MRSLPAGLITAKNSLQDSYPILILLDIALPSADPATTLYLVRNTENITWNSQLYTAFPFDITAVNQGRNTELPTVNLSISNVNRVMQSYVEELDGAIDSEVIITRIHSNHVTSADYFDKWYFIITSTECNNQTVNFVLSSRNIYDTRFPRNRMRRNVCRFRFKSTECGYAGAETSCNRTFSRCLELANTERYGGFTNIGGSGLQL